MFPVNCVICGKPCSRELGNHWYLCKNCNAKYWAPNKGSHTFSSFLKNIEYFKYAYKNEQDSFWKGLESDDSKTDSTPPR